MEAIKQLSYLVATGLFIFSLHWMNDPKTARRARVRRRRRHVVGRFGHLVFQRPFTSLVDHCGDRRGLRRGISAFARAAHGGAATDGAVARLRRIGGGTRGFGRVLHAARSDRTDITNLTIIALVAEVILGFLTFTGSLMATGKLQGVSWIPQRPVTYPLSKRQQHRLVAGCAVCWACWSCCIRIGFLGRPGVSLDRADVAGVRRAVDHSHRRRRYAHRDFDPEFVCRSIRRGDGLCARQ